MAHALIRPAAHAPLLFATSTYNCCVFTRTVLLRTIRGALFPHAALGLIFAARRQVASQVVLHHFFTPLRHVAGRSGTTVRPCHLARGRWPRRALSLLRRQQTVGRMFIARGGRCMLPWYVPCIFFASCAPWLTSRRYIISAAARYLAHLALFRRVRLTLTHVRSGRHRSTIFWSTSSGGTGASKSAVAAKTVFNALCCMLVVISWRIKKRAG